MGPYHCLRGGQACQYAFLGIKQAFNGDHREVLDHGGLEERIRRTHPVPSQSSVRPVRDAIGCQLALAFRPGSYRVPGGVKGRSWQVPGWYACGWYVKVYAKCLLNRMRDEVGKILFPVAIDWVLGKQQEKRGVKRHCDIAENTRDLQPLVSNIVRLQTALGSASGPKAINMLIGTHAPLRSVTIDKNKLKVAENYLGSSINNKGQMDNELDCRLGKASAAFNQLGFETYYVEISQEKRLESLDASDSECVRKILSIRRQDFIPNTDI
ncbi:hypothetical protein Bbelb_276280 [Branchiostoma belcheri]|nr:hypothetical protein Bbelb_276280 [Branchiostoma belcheri]